MIPNMDAYEKLVEQEDPLVKRVWTCEETSNTILYLLFQRGAGGVYEAVGPDEC